MNYRDFELQLSKESPNHYLAQSFDKGSIAAAQTFEIRMSELKVIEKLQRLEEKVTHPLKEETFHIEFGKELYRAVFSGKLGEYFRACRDEAQKSDAGLRICLRCDENAQELASLPWEFLYDDDFLVTSRNTLISRLPSGIIRVKTKSLESMLHMLVVVSSPNDPRAAPLNTKLEREVILEAVDKLTRDHKMEVDFTEDATLETIEAYLNEKEYHIVHFTGHGIFDKGRGYLILEKDDRKARDVDNNVIADLLAGRGVRLVVLSACQSGKVSNREAYADLASILIKKRIPAVVAMQYSILDLSATKFASVFYQALTNKPVDLALTEARIVMKHAEKSNGIDFATPVLYLSDPDCLAVGEIKPETSKLKSKPTMLPDVEVMGNSFVGRRKELRLLQKDFMSDVKRAAIIFGFGGIGKTVLATRLALKMNQHFEGIFGMKCSAATRPEEILNRLNAFLNLAGIQQFNQVLYDANFNLEAKTAVLVGILNQWRFLIILDNFEDCLDEARSSIANPELRVFIQHLLNSTITNTKYIITTRYNFDPLDGRLTGAIENISLPEMPYPETVWLMNNYKELADLDTGKKHRIYIAIGGNPWIIGQFAKHAASETVDHLLLELEPLKKDSIKFTLLDKSYSKLDEKARKLILHASIYQEAVPVEALSWIIRDEKEPNPPISGALSKLIDLGLISKQEELYMMHTLVRDFAEQETEKEKLDRRKLLIRASQYYENTVKATGNILNYLTAREYYYRAEEWEKADDIVLDTWEYLVRWGFIQMAMDLLNQSIDTAPGYRKEVAKGNLATIYQGLGDLKTALKLHTEVKEISEKEGNKKNVANALHWLGNIHYMQSNYEEARNLYQQSLDINEELGNKRGIAATLHQLAMIHENQGNYKEVVKHFQHSMEISEELGDNNGIAATLQQFGNIHFMHGNYKEAVKLYLQSLNKFIDLGEQRGIAHTLGQLGMIHQYQGNYEEAVKLYLQSLNIFEELGEQRGIMITLQALGNIHANQGNYKEAVKHFQHSMEISEELGDKDGIADMLAQLGMIHINQSNYAEALRLYQQSLDIKKELGDQDGIAKILHQLGMIQEGQGNYAEAIKLYQKSLKIEKELMDKNGIGCSLLHLGNIHRYKGNLEEAEKLYQQSLNIFEELGDKRGIAGGLHSLGNIHHIHGNYAEAVKLYQQSLKIKEELGDKRGIANTLGNLGEIRQQQGNYEEAGKLYQQSLKIEEELGNKDGIAHTLGQLGKIHYVMGNYEEAGKLCQQSLKIEEELGDKRGFAHTLHQLGMIYHDKGNHDEAVRLYQQSLKIEEELGDKSGIAGLVHQLGNIHYMQGNYEEAGKLYQKSLKIDEELGDRRGIAVTLHQLGNISHDQGKYEDALKLYQQSLNIFTDMGDISGIAGILHQLGMIDEEKVKNFPEAFEKYLTAFFIFKELNDPRSKIAERSISRVKEKMGEKAFNEAYEEIRRKHGT